jgi:hypothetical protein
MCQELEAYLIAYPALQVDIAFRLQQHPPIAPQVGLGQPLGLKQIQSA